MLNDNILDNREMLSFTVHCVKSNIWFSGLFKKINKNWIVKISTVLPNKDINGNKITPKFSINDYKKEINI